ncbi:MAG: UvrD-helicase domain-containing protein [Dehalococcoidales bacterium]|nr:UvrD-helicase domain-containing protein [Dehalococcoidales bacterium]
MFDDIDGKSLDEQQRTAVVNGEMNCLVAAGAGSGKTLTISAKVKYLVTRKGVKPGDILLITFTRKAAEEMRKRIRERLEIDVDVYTFHSFGLNILRRGPDVVQDILDENGISRIFKKYFGEYIFQSEANVRDLIHFCAYFLYQNPAKKGKYFEDQIETLKIMDLETLKSKMARHSFSTGSRTGKRLKTHKGEYVRSFEELQIANYLFLNGIEYEYETNYKGNSFPNSSVSLYRPDFYLPNYDIYIEHFGVDRNMRASFLSDERERHKYESSMEWKRRVHKANRSVLIETYSFQCQDGNIFHKLKETLSSYNVQFKPIDCSEFYKKVYIDGADRLFEEFTKLIRSFLSLYKANGSKLNADPGSIRTKLFMRIFNNFFTYYEDCLHETNTIDFDDMIIRATALVSDMKFTYKQVMIDEYQDISLSRYNLINRLVDNTNANLFAVGDDWQSVFRFAGSDIKLFSKFEQNNIPCELFKLETTYRSPQGLLSMAGDFILRNKDQIPKNLTSEKHRDKPIRLIIYNSGVEDKRIAFVKAVDMLVEEYGVNNSIMVLGRTKYDLEFMNDKSDKTFRLSYDRSREKHKIVYEKYPKLNMYYLTVHKAKGQEADNVIIANGECGLLGFPNEIEDDEMLQLVLSEPDKFAFAEERRLFYVALTRTKNSVYILVPNQNPSCFIDDIICHPEVNLVPLDNVERVDFNSSLKCPRCKKGNLVMRLNSKTSEHFMGCSNYPRCGYTRKINWNDNDQLAAG